MLHVNLLLPVYIIKLCLMYRKIFDLEDDSDCAVSPIYMDLIQFVDILWEYK